MSRLSRLWKELPPEILENVLACLPVYVLCRFRLVCKSWNHLITQPGFASLHAQATRRAPCVLISPRVLDFDSGFPLDILETKGIKGNKRNWEILDMADKRFYTLSDYFIKEYLLSDKEHEYGGWDKYTLAADGGLIYAIYDSGETQIRRHIVCNPVSKSFHQIPAHKLRFSVGREKIDTTINVMSVDTATQSYRIIAMEAKNKARSRREEVHLYESRTGLWRKLCEVPENYRAYSSVFLRGVFYTLFLDSSLAPWCPKLHSCDLETGSWSYIDVELPQPSCLQDRSLLVVSLGRLFFVEYTGIPIFPNNRMTTWETILASNRVKKKQQIKVSISEILMAERDVVKVAEMPKYAKYPRTLLDENRVQSLTGIGDTVVAVGYGGSIVISCLLCKGRRVGFDLLKKCWHELPGNTGHMLDNTHRVASRQGIYAGLVDLHLKEMSPRRIDSRLTS